MEKDNTPKLKYIHVQENVSNWEKIQTLIKEEVTLNETVNKHQQISIEALHKNFIEYYKTKLNIKDICEFNSKLIGISSLGQDSHIKVECVDNVEKDLDEICEPVTRLLFKFRNNFEFVLHLVTHCKPENMEELSNLLCHFFYENIFSHSPDQEELLVLCYLLLEKEVELLNTPSVSSFLDRSFLGKLLRSFSRRQDIKSYLSMVLGDLILKMENMTDNFLEIEVSRIYEYIRNNRVKEVLNKSFILEKTKRIFEIDKRSYLAEKVRKTTIWKFDETDSNGSGVSPKKKQGTPVPITGRKCSIFPTSEDILNLDNYFDEEKSEQFNFDYQVDLTEEELKFRFEKEKDPQMKEFFLRQLKKIDDDKEIFTNQRFLENLSVFNSESYKVLYIYKQNFEKIKFFIDDLFNNLMDNDSIIPYVIKSICKMIDILITRKFPEISFLDKNSFIAEFVFGRLIMPILSNPDFNGIISSTVISMNTRKNMMIINKIIRKAFRANFFDSVLETNYTIFNTYFVEIMPTINRFFTKLTKVTLPRKIEDMIHIGSKGNLDYDYFKEYPEELISIQSICFSMSELAIFIKSIKEDEEFFSKDKTLFKSYEKLEIHDAFISNKIKESKLSNLKKYYILINDQYNPKKVNLLYPKQFNFNLASKKKEGDDCNAIELVLPRVKFCIKNILRNINIINCRVYSHLEKADTAQKLFAALSKIIQLDEYSDNLTNDKIPLSWYSLYLESNLPYLSEDYTKDNFSRFYEELYNEIKSDIDMLNYKSNLIITKLGMKLRCAEKVNEIIRKECLKVKQIEKFIRVEKFMHNGRIPVCVRARMNEDDNTSIIVSKVENCIHRFHHLEKALDGRIEKKNIVSNTQGSSSSGSKGTDKDKADGHCDTILDFIYTFQNFKEIKEDIVFGDQRNKIYESLDSYLSLVQEELRKDNLFSGYLNEDNLQEILEEIEMYIIKKVYRKVFPAVELEMDTKFFHQCLILDWVTPHHLEINKKYINENLWVNAVTCLNKMDDEKSPIDKLKCVQSAYKILNNSINFCSGKEESAGVDDIIPILIYIIIQSKPRRMFSNMQYIKTFMNPSKLLATCGFLLTQIEMSTEFILGITHKVLKISEEEFLKNMTEGKNRIQGLTKLSRK